MGQTLLGGSERKEDINLLTPQQASYLSNILGSQTGNAQQSFGNILSPESISPEMFQKSVVDPTLLQFQRNVAPAIQNQFLGGDEKASGALNRALAQSASDLSTYIGSQYGNFRQQGIQNQLQGLGLLNGLVGQKTFEPWVQQNQGILGPLLGFGGQIGSGILPFLL